MARLVRTTNGRGRAREARDPSDAPAAVRRMSPARFADARLWLGIGLLVSSTAIGARVMTAGDDTVTVWRAGRALSVGSEVSGLEAVAVSRAVAGDRYSGPGDDLAGVLRWPIAVGELLPRGALGERVQHPTRGVTLPVDPLHAPTDLQPGDLVDVWSSPRDAPSSGPPSDAVTAPVLSAVTVTAVSADALGVSGEMGVVLAVPLDEVAAIVSAIRSGVIDLVSVPPASQAVAS